MLVSRGLNIVHTDLAKMGFVLDGELWEQTMSRHLTREKESQLLEEIFPTPMASDNRDRGNISDPAIQRRIKLGKQISLTMAVKKEKGGGSHNHRWTEWLMFPIGHKLKALGNGQVPEVVRTAWNILSEGL